MTKSYRHQLVLDN